MGVSMADDLACAELVDLVTEYLEEVLPEPLRDRFEAHLEVCPGCHLYLGQMRLTIRALRRRRRLPLSPLARQSLIAEFRRWANPIAG